MEMVVMVLVDLVAVRLARKRNHFNQSVSDQAFDIPVNRGQAAPLPATPEAVAAAPTSSKLLVWRRVAWSIVPWTQGYTKRLALANANAFAIESGF